MSHICHHEKHAKADHHEMMVKDFKKRFLISLLLTIPILALSPMIQSWFHYDLSFPGDSWILFILSSVVFFYGGWPFLKGTIKELSEKNPAMMTLIGIAITVAYTYSVAAVFFLKGKTFFWELVTLIDIMLLGHWIEMRSVIGASRSLEFLVKLMPSVAHVLKDNVLSDLPLEQIRVDDIVIIKPGEQIPADGQIIEGTSTVNESLLTGEAMPVKKKEGDKVIGGSLNGMGSLKVHVQRMGKDSYLSKVISLVREAQEAKSKTQRLADRAAKVLTFVAISSGLITFFSWILIGSSIAFCLERMVTVMVISCPHALGLAIPLVVAVSTGLAARHGLLIRNRTAFENSRKISVLVFDKTGTLTEGKFGVIRYESLSDYSKDEILQLAASVEQYSEHPIGVAIVEKIKEKKQNVLNVENFQGLTGEGVEGVVKGKHVQIVSPGYLKKKKISYSVASQENETLVFVLIDQKLAGVIALADAIRAESFQGIELLKKEHIKMLMVTGDNEKVAHSVSDQLKLDGYYAETLPHQKLEIVKELQQKGEFVAMTGDGINDAPALAQADIGIAVGSGTDIAAETADIILVESNLVDILSLILFGKATYTKMVQNLLWATAYNVIAIPLAAGILFSYGIIISPALGAVLMSISTIIVAVNARLLRVRKIIKR